MWVSWLTVFWLFRTAVFGFVLYLGRFACCFALVFYRNCIRDGCFDLISCV